MFVGGFEALRYMPFSLNVCHRTYCGEECLWNNEVEAGGKGISKSFRQRLECFGQSEVRFNQIIASSVYIGDLFDQSLALVLVFFQHAKEECCLRILLCHELNTVSRRCVVDKMFEAFTSLNGDMVPFGEVYVRRYLDEGYFWPVI